MRSFYGLCQQVVLRIEAVETEFVEWDPEPLGLLLHKGEDLDVSHPSSLLEHLALSRLCSCDLASRLLAGFADEVAEIPQVVRVRLPVLGRRRRRPLPPTHNRTLAASRRPAKSTEEPSPDQLAGELNRAA